jgi:hypothetical protein
MTTPQVPEVPDARLQRVEELVQRVQRSLLDGLEGVLQRQVPPSLEQTRRAILETTEEVLTRHADLLTARLKDVLLETAEELEKRQLEPFLERLKQTVVAILGEVWQRYTPPLVTRLQETLSEAVREGLRGQMDTVVAAVRQGLREGTEFTREQTDLLLGKVRQTVTDPLARVAREHFPEYAHWFGGRVVDYALATTLFCVAAILLLVGSVQGLQHAGVPPYLTYFLGGLGGVGAGVVFLRLSTYVRRSKNGIEPPGGQPRPGQRQPD